MTRRGFNIIALIVLGMLLLASGPSSTLAAGFVDPLGGTTLAGIIVKVTRYLLGLAGFLAMAAMVWGGVLYIISLGNDSGVQQAKKVILWAVVGLMVIILSYVILRTVSGFLGVVI